MTEHGEPHLHVARIHGGIGHLHNADVHCVLVDLILNNGRLAMPVLRGSVGGRGHGEAAGGRTGGVVTVGRSDESVRTERCISLPPHHDAVGDMGVKSPGGDGSVCNALHEFVGGVSSEVVIIVFVFIIGLAVVLASGGGHHLLLELLKFLHESGSVLLVLPLQFFTHPLHFLVVVSFQGFLLFFKLFLYLNTTTR